MLRLVISLSTVLTSGIAVAQAVDAPSPLPTFDTETGAPIVLESVISPDTLQNIEQVAGTSAYDMARIVARVEQPSGDGFCTGFRVGESLFMTNYHCWEVADCNVQFHMGYETALPADQQSTYRCTEVLLKLESLDFALFRVEPTDAVSTVEYPIATLSKAPLVVDMPLIVPGHPAARPKQIDTSDQCKLTRAVPYRWYDRDNIQHQCDTLGGSSGSPVINRTNGHVVGIHWGATGGTPSNHAIPMALVLAHIEQERPDVYPELTVQP